MEFHDVGDVNGIDYRTIMRMESTSGFVCSGSCSQNWAEKYTIDEKVKKLALDALDSTITDEYTDRIFAKGEEATGELDAKMKKFT
ncbi:hypothetical protein L1987_70962 [Smallanthus sonchifolius]|uniref:Uncharacterized protein n=1 Tax=Smallanthus sonchifolius TaxID=185202 RepID=A0ACB9ASF9_9ASTR|nr:hypothetical protein L1987_70962 [Smallanthus sonchifolius]